SVPLHTSSHSPAPGPTTRFWQAFHQRRSGVQNLLTASRGHRFSRIRLSSSGEYANIGGNRSGARFVILSRRRTVSLRSASTSGGQQIETSPSSASWK